MTAKISAARTCRCSRCRCKSKKAKTVDPMDTAFAREMQGRLYGEDERTQAYEWFRAGWIANDSKSKG